jgi:hypothetical protein
MSRRVHLSARKHGIADEDIHQGPSRAANLLEVITIVESEESEIVIHAMVMRAKYLPLLRGVGGIDA